MANKWAIATGNWSATTTWNDGVIPTEGDIVYANSYTITFTSSDTINVSKLSNKANDELSVVSGGGFIASGVTISDTIELTADIDGDGTNYCICPLYANMIINGDVDGFKAIKMINATASVVNCTINGDVTGGVSKDSENDNSGFYFRINGNFTVPTGQCMFYSIRDNWYSYSGTTFYITGDLDISSALTTQRANANGFCVSVYGDMYIRNVVLDYTPYSSLGEVFYLDKGYKIYGIAGFGSHISIVFGTYCNLYKDGQLMMIGVNIVNYPSISNVKLGVQYGANNMYTGTYTELTDAQKQRILNCCTIQELQQCFTDFKEEDE